MNNVNEIDLSQVLKSLKERNRFIVGLTSIVTLIVIVYLLSFAPPSQYKIKTSFHKPSESSVLQINKYSLLADKTAESVFTLFLTNLNSAVLQKQVFLDGGYRDKLQKEGVVIEDVDSYITDFTQLILISKDNSDIVEVELPHILSAQSSNPDVVSEFLNEILLTADNKTVTSINKLNQLKIVNRLQDITSERQLLLTKLKQDRLSQIKRIKEADSQKLRETNNKIDAARLTAKVERMNQIAILTNAAKLAGTLGITGNNLNQFNNGKNNTILNIAIQSGANIPDWYLYGETALLEMIALLEARESDDPYIPELVLLDNLINEINNNALIQTLEQRFDDSPFNSEISKLDFEAINLKNLISLNSNSTNFNAMKLYQTATSQILPTKNRLIVILAFIGSFMLSIVLVLLMNALKEEDVTSIQKGK